MAVVATRVIPSKAIIGPCIDFAVNDLVELARERTLVRGSGADNDYDPT
jgi:hypothetical protein